MCRICSSPPGNLGNHAGRLAVDKPFTGSPGVLLITTQGRPAHLTCGQTIACIIIPRPRSWRKGKLLPLSGQNASLKTNNTSRHPLKGRQLVCGSSWRFFRSLCMVTPPAKLRPAWWSSAGTDGYCGGSCFQTVQCCRRSESIRSLPPHW